MSPHNPAAHQHHPGGHHHGPRMVEPAGPHLHGQTVHDPVAEKEFLTLILFGVAILTMVVQYVKLKHQKRYQQFMVVALWLFPAISCVISQSWRFVAFWVVFSALTGYHVFMSMQRPLPPGVPQRIYTFFSTLYDGSKVISVASYGVLMLLAFLPPLAMALPAFILDVLLTAVIYSLYVGVMTRDLVELLQVTISSNLAYKHTKKEGKQKGKDKAPQAAAAGRGAAGKKGSGTAAEDRDQDHDDEDDSVLPPNTCAVCGDRLLDLPVAGQQAASFRVLEDSSANSSNGLYAGQLFPMGGVGGASASHSFGLMDSQVMRYSSAGLLQQAAAEEAMDAEGAEGSSTGHRGGSSSSSEQQQAAGLPSSSRPGLSSSSTAAAAGSLSSSGSTSSSSSSSGGLRSSHTRNASSFSTSSTGRGSAGDSSSSSSSSNDGRIRIAQGADGREVFQLGCHHAFHGSCLKGWALLGKKNSCPCCSEKVELKALVGQTMWAQPTLLWGQLLELARYVVVWIPLLFTLVRFASYELGIQPVRPIQPGDELLPPVTQMGGAVEVVELRPGPAAAGAAGVAGAAGGAAAAAAGQ